jgi:hypothetical protein
MPVIANVRKGLSQGGRFLGLSGGFDDQSDALKNAGQVILFTHVPTGTTVEFKAFLTQFQDQFSSKWQSQAGYGRMDNIQMFQQTTRHLQITFKVVAASLEEAKSNMVKMSTFSQMLYPTFDGSGGAQTMKAAPLIKLKFMNWAQNATDGTGLMGATKGFSFAPVLEPGVFTTKDAAGIPILFPKELAVSIQMDVIHEHALGWRKEKTSPSSHVTPNSQKLKTATVTSWFQPQSELFPYGERVGDSPRQQKQSKVKNPNYEEKTKKEITTPDVNTRGGGSRDTSNQTLAQIGAKDDARRQQRAAADRDLRSLKMEAANVGGDIGGALDRRITVSPSTTTTDYQRTNYAGPTDNTQVSARGQSLGNQYQSGRGQPR